MTDLDAVDEWLRRNPINDADGLERLGGFLAEQRRGAPLVAADSIDVVVSNCVLNLVRESSKRQVFQEIFRVLKRGGRAVISDIVSDEPVPEHLRNDPELWSGCVSGALEQGAFLEAFEQAGFHGIEILKRDAQPWRTVEGIEFRSITVRAMKGKQGPCWDCNQAVIYRGPWRKVEDDDGHILVRGQPLAVCEKTFRLYTAEPYARRDNSGCAVGAGPVADRRSRSTARATPSAIRARPRAWNTGARPMPMAPAADLKAAATERCQAAKSCCHSPR